MFSLVISIVAIALVALLALAAMYYGTDALNNSSARAASSKAIAQTEQILGAAELFNVEQQRWSNSVQELIDQHYIQSDVGLQTITPEPVLWTQPMPGHPTYWAKASTDAETCRLINLQARGDNGIYNKARYGLVTQCFGAAAPFTTITTRVTDQDPAKGLKVVFDFLDEELWGYDPSGGGWAVGPTVVNYDKDPVDGGPAPEVAQQGAGGSGGESGSGTSISDTGLTIVFADGAAAGFFGSFTGGSFPAKQLQVSNTNAEVALAVFEGYGRFKVSSTTCGVTLAPGEACTVTVIPSYGDVPAEGLELKGGVAMGGKRLAMIGFVRSATASGSLPLALSPVEGYLINGGLVFPDTPVGKSSSKWLRVTNIGAFMSYDGEGYRITSPFSMTNTTCGAHLPVGAACLVRLTFTPKEKVAYAAASHYYDVLANEDFARLPLSGRGVDAEPVKSYKLTLATTQLTFGAIPALASKEMSVRLSNTGSAAFSFSEQPSIVSGGAAFRLNSVCTSTIQPGSYCDLRVTYNPDEQGVHRGALSVEDQEVELEGVATNPLTSAPLTLKGYKDEPGALRFFAPALWNTVGSTIDYDHLVITVPQNLPEEVDYDSTSRMVTVVPSELKTGTRVTVPMSGLYQSKFQKDTSLTMEVADTRPPGINGVQTMASPYSAACAITSNGQVQCWGSASPMFGGIPGYSSGQVNPVNVAGLSGVVQLSSQNQSFCALTGSGQVYCWGVNVLGGSKIQNYSSPTRVTTSVTFKSIKGGQVATCGISTTDSLYCWGVVLGTKREAPTNIASNVKDFGVGNGILCIVTTSNELKCKGNSYVAGTGEASTSSWTTPVGFEDGAIAVNAYSASVCAIDKIGGVWCWGGSSYGETGVPYTTPTPYRVISAGMERVDFSYSHQVCATGPAAIYCWGYNNDVIDSTKGYSAVVSATDLTPYVGVPKALFMGNNALCVYNTQNRLLCKGGGTGSLIRYATTATPTALGNNVFDVTSPISANWRAAQ